MSKILTGTLIALIALVLIWHIGFFLLGGTIAITAVIWSLIVASIVIFGLGILLVFILTGLGVAVLAIIALLWTIIVILLFPVLFPVLVPLAIILLLAAYLRRRERRKQANTTDQP